ncbi:MAG TPA: hypothetical protein VN627_13735, partial [Novosphingobium sp.]|nr:hypothetical protein [Novosphingobium sp.]
MTAAAGDHETAARKLEIAVRSAGVGPRFAAALSAWMIRQARSVSGLDYSLIDYRGMGLAASQLSFEWWLEPQRTVVALTELWWRNLALIANHA